jgi:MFS family permease
MDHLDRFTSERIKGRFYQYSAIVLLGLINFCNGGFMTLPSLLRDCIEKDFQVSKTWISVLFSVYQVGIMIGSTLGGEIAKSKGRSISIKIFLTQHLIFGGLIYVCNNFNFLLLLFTIYGVFNGFCLNVLSAYSAEVSPVEIRGKLMICVNCFLACGKIAATLLCFFFLSVNDPKDWKNQIIYMTLLTAVVYPIVLFFLKESLRYLYANKKYEEFEKVTNQIIKINNIFAKNSDKTPPVSRIEVEYLEHQTDIYNENEEKGTYKMLFSKKFFQINVLVWTVWSCLFMIIVGQTMILLDFFNMKEGGLFPMIIITSGEIPALLFGYLMIDRVSVGRRKLLQSFTFLVMLFFSITFFFEVQYMITILFLLTRFAIKGAFIVLVPFTSEVYPTKLRSLGLGVGGALGGFWCIIMSFFIFDLLKWDKRSTLVFFAILGFISLVCCLKLPYDTTGRALDTDHVNDADRKEIKEDLLAKDLTD